MVEFIGSAHHLTEVNVQSFMKSFKDFRRYSAAKKVLWMDRWMDRQMMVIPTIPLSSQQGLKSKVSQRAEYS